MTSHWLFQVTLLAVVLFWLVGAYNRLLRLRGAVGTAWVQLLGALGKRSEAMAAVIDAVREPLASEAATLQALADADAQVLAAAEGVRHSRGRIADVSPWAGAEAALSSPAARLRALIELQPALLGDPAHGPKLTPALAAWREAEPRLQFARQGFNDAVDTYNKAIHQWPTRIVSELFRFRPAART